MLYGYARVSTDEQSISLANQVDELKAYAKKVGEDLPDERIFFDEDVSGSIPLKDRPYGKRMWDLLQPGDHVVVTKLDRGWRNTADAAGTLNKWRQYGVKLSILDFPIDTATDEGEMMFCQFASWAQYERKRIGRRVSDAFQYLRRNRRPYSISRPLGWIRKGKEYVEFTQEREMGAEVIALRERGVTFPSIALRFAKMGLRKPTRSSRIAGWYSVSDVQTLYRAAVNGYPTIPQVVLRASDYAARLSAEGFGASQPASGA